MYHVHGDQSYVDLVTSHEYSNIIRLWKLNVFEKYSVCLECLNDALIDTVEVIELYHTISCVANM